jgi:hypothetical protein
MKSAVYAATDIAFDTKTERFLYPKGSFIQLELAPTGDVYVIHSRLAEKEVEKDDGTKVTENTVVSTNLKFIRLEDLTFALDNLVFEDQLSEAIDFRDIALDDAIVTERIPPVYIAAYLVDETSPVEKEFNKNGNPLIRIPVRTISKEMTHRDKVGWLRGFDVLEDHDFGQSQDVLSLTARAAGNVNETKHLVDLPALSDVRPFLPSYLESKLKTGLPKDWRVRRVTQTNEGEETKTDRIRLFTNGDQITHYENFVSTLPITVEHTFNREKEYLEVHIIDPDLPEVVESFFTKPIYSEKFTLIDGEENKEGSKCVNENGDVGKLVKQNDKLVCMTKEAYEPDFSDKIQVGDPCQSAVGLIGEIKQVDGNLACVCKEWQNVDHTEFECDLSEAERTAGSACKKGDQQGTLQVGPDGKLVCRVPGQAETIAFTIPPIEEAESYTGYPLSPGSSPSAGDPCDYQGKPGVLILQNGALICGLGGQKPKGADGAN